MTKKPETRQYKLTKLAGPWVAGRRAPPKGETLDLTDAQADHPLRMGEIVPFVAESKQDGTQDQASESVTKPAGKPLKSTSTTS